MDLINMREYPMQGSKEDEEMFLVALKGKEAAQTKIQEISFKHQENLPQYTDDQTLEQVAKKDCIISLLRVIQILTGHGLINLFQVILL